MCLSKSDNAGSTAGVTIQRRLRLEETLLIFTTDKCSGSITGEAACYIVQSEEPLDGKVQLR